MNLIESKDDKYWLGEFEANEAQKIAIDEMIGFLYSDEIYYLLIGRGGTGKSTIIKKIIDIYNRDFTSVGYSSMFSTSVICAAISHAAKNVLQSFIGDSAEVITVAKLLGMKQNITEEGEIVFEPDLWQRREPLPIQTASLIVIDECSMISESLLKIIQEMKNEDTKIIFMGDNVQLPPIDVNREPNEDSPTFQIPNFSKLTDRIRQGEDSPIVPITDLYANNIEKFNVSGKIVRNPLTPELRVDNYDESTGKGVLFESDLTGVFKSILDDLRTNDGKHNPNYVKAIAYRNKNLYGKAKYSIATINMTIRKHLWNVEEEYVEGDYIVANNNYMPGNSIIFHNSDSMLVTHVSRGLHLGIDCYILNLVNNFGERRYAIPVVSKEGKPKYIENLKAIRKQAISGDRSKWKKYYHYRDQFADIAYGYAINSHKAQGSTYHNVYVFEDDIFSVAPTTDKEKNQSMYVACTRASHKLTIFKDGTP